MERRTTHIDTPKGVTLEPSTMGGFSISLNSVYVGWIHSAGSDRWKAYIRTGHPLGDYLGTCTRDEAIERVITEKRHRDQPA